MELVRSTPPRLRVEATAAQPFEHPDVFVASPPTVFGGKPDIEISGSRVVLNSILYGDVADVLRAPSIEVTLVDGSRAVAASLPLGSSQPASVGAGAAPDAPATETGAGSWWGILAIAWLGGLVLNLMPCVLPVLSLKLLGAIGRGESGRTLRSDFVASAAGVVASFMALATALVAFRSAGATIGWGIQFQHPLFLAGMAMVVALFAANLLGFFEISLPPLLMNALARRGMGSSAPANFASGFVATLLATPCSAPFVGTAVGFALSRGSAEIYAVFGALGVGMASPYLVAASVPRLTAFLLPRPGAWMVQFRRAMAIPLLATTAWLVFLIGATAGPLTALLTGAALVIGVAGLWWRNNAPAEGAIIMVSSGLILAAVAIFVGTTPDTSPANTDIHAIRWRPLSELDDLKQSGDIIFVDVTAAWCATCKVNKALVLDDRNIAERLASDVIPVRADWTSPDPRIAEYLKTFGRYGLPFNVVFGPNAPNGIVLPELLTRSAVLSAFAESSVVTQSDNK
jgi:suppressor for copper-sensitivity B